jgi:hypothetical protein
MKTVNVRANITNSAIIENENLAKRVQVREQIVKKTLDVKKELGLPDDLTTDAEQEMLSKLKELQLEYYESTETTRMGFLHTIIKDVHEAIHELDGVILDITDVVSHENKTKYYLHTVDYLVLFSQITRLLIVDNGTVEQLRAFLGVYRSPSIDLYKETLRSPEERVLFQLPKSFIDISYSFDVTEEEHNHLMDLKANKEKEKKEDNLMNLKDSILSTLKQAFGDKATIIDANPDKPDYHEKVEQIKALANEATANATNPKIRPADHDVN